MAIQERENDLVLATFGRGFYVLDDYTPLRQLSQATFDRDGHIFPTKAATIEAIETGKARGSQGENLWMGENRPLGRDPHLLDQGRGAIGASAPDAGVARRDQGSARSIRRRRELTAEADEEAPQTFLTITDSANKVVRRLTVPGGRGIHRYVWNLRGIAPTTGGGGFGGGGGGGGGGNDDDDADAPIYAGGTGGGPYVVAGHLSRALSRRVGGNTTNLGEAQTITVAADPACTHHARAAHRGDDLSGQRREAAAHLHRRARAGEQHAHAHAGDPPRARRLTGRRQADGSGACSSIAASLAVLRSLRGDETLRGTESGSPTSVQNRVNSAVARIARPERRADRHAAAELHDRERRSHRAGRVAENARSGVEEVRAAARGGGSTVHSWKVAGPVASWPLRSASIPSSASPARNAAAAVIASTSSSRRRRSTSTGGATHRRGFGIGQAPMASSRDPFEPIPGTPLQRIRKRADGACGFLSDDNRCRIHEELGAARKPLTCRLFPYAFHTAADGVVVTASFGCPTIVANEGPLIGAG